MAQEVKPIVAHVNHHFFAATQTFIYHYLSHLQRVHSICLTRSPESKATLPPEALPDSFYLYGNNRSTGIQDVMQKVWDLGVREVITRSPPALANRLLKWIHRFIVPMVRSQKYVEGYVEWAGEIIRKRNVQLIHAYYGPIAWRLLHLKRKLHLPFIVSFLGDDIMPTLPPWYQCWIGSGSVKSDWTECLSQLMNEADLILVEGPFFQERVIELGCPPERVQIQRIAIPLKRFPFRARRLRPDGKVIILFAGRFVEVKGLLYALKAVRELWIEGRNIEFRIIGDEKLTGGGDAAQIRTYIRRNALQGCVRLLGHLSHRSFLQEMEKGDLFIQPSITTANGATEGGAPTTILEAQALGMPILSTFHCDIPNVTVPGQSALLVPERDSKALAQALRTLVDTPGKWEEMGVAGRRHVERFHDIEKEAPRLEEKYLQLMSGRNQT